MKVVLAVSLVFMLCAQLNAWARDPYVDINETMCVDGEDVYISCAFDDRRSRYDYIGEVASICAKGNASPDTGYVQYRFGKPSYGSGQAKIEMQFPEKKVPPKGIFNIYTSVNFETIGSALRFVSGNYLYSFERSSMSGYEVVVRKQDEKVFNRRCTLPGVSYLVDGAYQGIQTIDLGEEKISGANKCSGMGLREAYSSMELDRVNACIVYTKANLQSDAQLFRETDGISLYSVVLSEYPKLVYEFPYAGTEGTITDAFFLQVGGGEEMLFVIHRIEAPRSWDSVSDIYDVSVFRLEGDNLLLDKNFTRFFDLGGDSVDEQGRSMYIYPYKDKKSVEAVVGSPLFYSIVADKEITGTILEKTFLFDGGSEPIKQSKAKMYLIEGDRVLVTDSTAGWCKVSYEAKIKMITKWAQCKSINFSAS